MDFGLKLRPVFTSTSTRVVAVVVEVFVAVVVVRVGMESVCDESLCTFCRLLQTCGFLLFNT